jgi:hypothetical protein
MEYLVTMTTQAPDGPPDHPGDIAPAGQGRQPTWCLRS